MFFINAIRNGASFSEIIVVILCVLLAAMTAIVAHELAHGYVALKCGDYTAKSRGRLTLNPVAHFDLWGLLLLLFAGFGWAKPVPVDTRNFRNYKKNMIAVSVAGVLTNLVLALISLLLWFLLVPTINKYLASPNAVYSILSQFAYYILTLSIQINFMLAFFNILPIYPLDGYNLVATLLKRGNKFKDFMIRYGFFVLIGLLIGGRFFSTIGLPFLDVFGMFGQWVGDIINSVMNASFKVFGVI